jgi:hypothetical protein
VANDIEQLLDASKWTNADIKRVIDHISISKNGQVTVYLKLLGNTGLDEEYLVRPGLDDLNAEDSKEKVLLSCSFES